MNIKALSDYIEQNGNEFKSYRHLCEVLGVKDKAGGSRPAQRKEFERFFELIKGEVGNKWNVKEIYDMPKEKQVNRRNNIYGEMVELAIMDYLIKSKRHKTTATRNHLLGEIEMINHNFNICNKNRKRFAEFIGINNDIVNEFFNNTNGNFRRILERALDELQERAIIKYSIVTIVNSFNSENKKATDAELEFILECEKTVLNDLGYDKKRGVRNSGKWFDFTEEVKKLLHQESEINYYYSSYEIVVNKKFVQDEHEKIKQYIISESQRIDNRNKLTATIEENLITNASGRQAKARRDHEMNKVNRRIRATFSYVDDIKRLVNFVISQKATNINEINKVEH